MGTGAESVDAQRTQLIEIINHLLTAMASGTAKEEVGGILDDLAGYATTHFSHYLLDDDPRWGEAAAAVVDAVAGDVIEGVIASLGVAETLVGAARADDGTRFELAAATMRDLGFTVAALDADAAEDAAWIRGRTGASLADSVHLACARAAGATAFITNDRRIRPGRSPEIIYLDELEEGGSAPGVNAR